MTQSSLLHSRKGWLRYGVWAVLLMVAVVGGLCLMAKFHHPHRHLFSTPVTHESFPMPRSTPDRG